MNPLFQRLMNEATRLTRGGNLQDATDAIQRALRGEPSVASAPTPMPAADAPPHHAAVVIDVPARVVGDEAVPMQRTDSASEQWTDGSFTHQGRTLAYKLYLPPAARAIADAPQRLPLVLMLHGCTQNPDDFAAGTQMNTLARELGVAVLYPAQTQPANPQKCWNWFKPQHQQRGRGEPAALVALTQSVMAANGIDPARVYVAGLSAGGAMADILGRSYPDVFAAVGVHSGLPAGAAHDVMSAMAAMHGGPAMAHRTDASPMPPLIVFHGDADATVSARNGEAVVAGALGARNAGDAAPQRAAEGASAGGQRFTRTVYAAADGHQAVEYWQLHGAGHAWSGGSARGSFTDPRGADASSEMLRFFLAHPKANA
ncbi:extracellular catalytic domain type 1 short-chain-length polyhydroxyalkanoate depolymerase [Variovorax sp. PAMC 28711]|uniref:extracellular catalytic domain type 1 short-chain-length polyhydroxyalkanoate depolymerase n=1 Tax=Variovorax sp. PAMC 28711 TaxID=1795631 RepID=UPI00078D0570|nr:PHB depolymerase family esterase [Variovorax sp. PAMC 28711]AMM24231.1 esterase [Variovorax sp. PAMC 28711]